MNSAKYVDTMISDLRKQGVSKSDMVISVAEAMMEWPYVWGAVGADCTVAKRQYYMGRSGIGPGDVELIRKRCQVLNGSKAKCDGCKYYPNEERTRINDCQGFVKQVFKAADIILTGGGCTSMWKNNALWAVKGEIKDLPMNTVCCVFKYISSTGKMDHIGIHVGNGKIIHCSVEVKTGKTTDKGWTHYGIPKGMDGEVPVPDTRPTLRKGNTGIYVVELQNDLITLGYDVGKTGADGIFGTATEKAVKQFQSDHGLVADGIVGQKTWAAIDEALKPSPEPGTKLYTVHIPHLTEYKADALIAAYSGSWKTEE